uniref:Uncharacterized LOC100184972 n=1 Tax=Ciona intestinalis TaxID=7719 RepID=F6QLK3_CIOIN|nr:uncharacterized protein LOC100184972 isoform X2 [Ciona intestinalis]|eukprot:XP_002121869.1 uncharacterized protein LOC100184972 isoform X2 [Ciona intestinalis]
MYRQQAFVLCSAFLLALFIGKGSAAQCYQCTTTSAGPTPGCVTGALSATNQLQCPSGQDHCLTSTTYTTLLGVSTVTTVRACSAAALPSTTCLNLGAIGISFTSTCSTDNCNTGDNANTGVCGSAVKIAGGYSFIALSMLAALLAVQNLM